MRIWHYLLIPYLPNAQLKAMRYELGDMIKQYPNIKNGLVKYANNYSIDALYKYFTMVLQEFDKRKINHNEKYDHEIFEIVEKKKVNSIIVVFYNEHNDRYLRQCLFNLQEKADRGIIAKEDWQIIEMAFEIFLK